MKQPHFVSSAKPSAQPAETQRFRYSRFTRGAMVVDICLVAAWGATIPGLLWLGEAVGF